ncbi:2Fe-2S iron-sulfur cluster-binding protein [Rhodococcus sp. JVH1]|uniref:2Fe-2S iron-sulfur cluster-binding protein n=1 Tax=Rhodococcus sp. JVH1 TaxID=745408 RepID=UPI0002720E25|nr:2Fe-2S iron-sulfur cluster-binding protein [Rhodococcus sp. JVH1]EJI95865.1 rhodocoxin [Rhodococcus sp. JVH1]
MPKVTFRHSNGTEDVIDATPGTSLMQNAMLSDVPGIVAECGGSMMCATCHVFVKEDWLEQVGEPGDLEQEMLESTTEPRQPSSRLSCQITVAEDMDGLIVETPRTQI